MGGVRGYSLTNITIASYVLWRALLFLINNTIVSFVVFGLCARLFLVTTTIANFCFWVACTVIFNYYYYYEFLFSGRCARLLLN